MPYYMGDFYQGDPGFLSTFGKIFSRAAGAIPGVGPLISRTGEAIMRIGKPAAAGAATVGIARRGVEAVTGVVVKHPVLSAAGAAGVVGIAAGAGAERLLAPGAAPLKGYHLTRRQRVPRRPEPHLAKNRRMRATNPRALSRAIRRAHGFARLAKRVLAFTSPRRHKGHMYFKRRRKKA